MALPRGYRSFADFEREELRPDMRIGWTVDELEETGDNLDFDMDPFASPGGLPPAGVFFRPLRLPG
jgi:hypothetical protein